MSNYEYFYPGTPSSMESGYSNLFTGYQFPAGRLSLTTNINTGNQLQEVSNLLNQGVKNVEVSLVSKQIFDQIPKQHMKEIARLTKLTGSKVSLHAPFNDMTDLSGFSQQGGEWNEEQRKSVEREMIDIVSRGNQISDDGNVNITIHPSNRLPGTSYHMEKDNNGNNVKVMDSMPLYNIFDEKLVSVGPEVKYDPEKGAQIITVNPEQRINEYTEKFWGDQLRDLEMKSNEAGENIILGRLKTAAGKDIDKSDDRYQIDEGHLKRGELILKSTDAAVRDLYARAMKSANETNNQKAKDILVEAHNEYSKKVEEMKNAKDDYKKNVLIRGEAVDIMINKMKELSEDKEAMPKLFLKADDFAITQTSKTLSNVALAAYGEYKDKAPTLSIENPPYGLSMSSGEELSKLIKESRNKLAEGLVDKQGLSYDNAVKVADKMIGATWDTAHISGMKSHGFSDKEIFKEVEKISPFVKHVHMNDSLGGQMMGDLPPGMGDVPISKILGEFADKGFKGTAVFESGGFAAMHRIPPQQMVFEAMNSPIYSAQAGPGWNRFAQAGNESIYYSGMGNTIPETSFQMYGGGFSGLPTELGGQQAGRGGGSPFSGAPMA